MARIRTLKEALEEIKLQDPGTALTPWRLRQMVLEGQIPAFTAGNKYLIDLDKLNSYLENPQIVQVNDVTDINRITPYSRAYASK